MLPLLSRSINAIKSTLDKITTRHVIHHYRASTGNSATYGGGYGSGAKFPGGTDNPCPIDIHNHYLIRQQVRRLMYDSVEARALVTTIVDTVAGAGPHVKPTPVAEILGITPESAEQWAEDVELRFNLWAQSKKSHRSRINNFYQNVRLYELFKQRDNDVFVRFYYGRDWDLTNPLQIDFIDPNQIRGYDYTSSYAQLPSGDDGIIRDVSGRETGYRIWMIDAQGKYVDTIIPAVGEKSGRIMMIHGFNPEYAGQGRGYSKMAHLIQELSDLTGFKISVLQKAINQASIVAAIENDQQDATQPLAGRVAGPIKEYAKDSSPSEKSGATDLEGPPVNWDVNHEATIRQPGSLLIGNLRRGDKWKNLQDTSPSPGYDVFSNSVYSYIAASMGWSIELVLKKFNANFSASRGTLLLCYRTAQIERNETRADFLDYAYEMWLAEDIASGRTIAPGWSDPYLRTAWLCADWSGEPVPNIDPLKTMEADRGYVELGAQTLDDVARNFNGSSGKANRSKNARQFEELPEVPWDKKHPAGNQNANNQDTQNQDGQQNQAMDRFFKWALENNMDVLKNMFSEKEQPQINITTPPVDIDVYIEKGKIKKTVNYTDINGNPKNAEITEEDI